ncbi:hypothetical protein LCGC14_0368150 [marine sediment metagenome]|uniref:Uncharacterized protein n=1 Tax=marine sediment metagenome TaxID=412755 RepID=A0A0F9WEC7_9ZZZZ
MTEFREDASDFSRSGICDLTRKEPSNFNMEKRCTYECENCKKLKKELKE